MEPLARHPSDERLWNLFELASLCEGYLHEQLDPLTISDATRLERERRISANGRPFGPPDRSYRELYWLLDRGRRVGTIALGANFLGTGMVAVSSLYVHPADRRRHIASRVLDAVFRICVDHGADGIRLDTKWTWQPAVRFYARIGMWVRMWKHSLVFVRRPDLPDYLVRFDDDSHAGFFVGRDPDWEPMIAAERGGKHLGWKESPQFVALYDEDFELAHCIPGTFAVHLALAGWPLVRSNAMWKRRYSWSDAGYPEGLAYKIGVFEEIDRRRGFEVRTPPRPGSTAPRRRH